MDSRIDMVQIFGLKEGDAHVLRNAGGLVTDDVIRSLVLSQRLLGTREVVIMQHTNCGLEGLPEAELLGRMAAEVGQEPPFTFGGFEDVDESVRAGIERVRSSPWLLGTPQIRGLVYDVSTGAVREV